MPAIGEIDSGVLFGTDGYLFLAEGNHNVFDYLLGRKGIPESALVAFVTNAKRRREFFSRRNVPYAHCISPDKHSVMVHNLPFDIPDLLGDMFLRHDPSITDTVFFPCDLLRSLTEPAFLKTDTHMTDAGTIVCVGALVERLTGDRQDSRCQMLREELQLKREWIGDLGSKFSPPLSEVRIFAELPESVVWLHNTLHGGNNGIVDIYFNDKAFYQKRFVVFGDSFGREYAKTLSRFFRDTIFLRTAFLHEELVDSLRPDYVVTQNVERYLDSCRLDEGRPSFFMYPHFSGNPYAPTAEFAEAFSAALSGGRLSLGEAIGRTRKRPELIFRVDEVSAGYISGWARGGEEPVGLELVSSSFPIMPEIANRYRRDLDTVGIGHGRYGYAFQIPPPGLANDEAIEIRGRGTATPLWSGRVPAIRHPGLDIAYSLAKSWERPADPIWRVECDGTDTTVSCNGFVIPTPDIDRADVQVRDKESGDIVPSSSGPVAGTADYSWFLGVDIFHLTASVPRLQRRQLLTITPDSQLQFIAIPSSGDFERFLFAGADRAARVAGGANKLIAFASGGLTSALQLRSIIRRLPGIPDQPTVLDWGCGAGRVCQFLAREEVDWKIHGADIDAVNVDWCKDALSSLVTFQQIGLLPPTSYRAATFDVVFGISVITHLSEGVRNEWLNELARIIRPGGYCILTFGSPFYLLSSGLHKSVLPLYQELKNRGISDGQSDRNLGKEFENYYRTVVNTFQNLASAVSPKFQIIETHPLCIVYQDTVVMRRLMHD